MKPTNIFLTVIGVTLTLLFCAQFARRSALAAATPMNKPVRHFDVTHNHDNRNGHDVTWELKDKGGNGAFLLTVDTNQIIEWENKDGKQPWAIIVNDRQNWDPLGLKWITPPKHGPGCDNCGEIETTSGAIQLKFINKTMTKYHHYQIVVPDQTKKIAPIYDYDMVDATVVWSDTLEGNKRKASETRN
jgi:hypothetical protein